jgi:ectonucleotide pyrophosphatase/phosphodiesterase family member 5
MLRLNILILSLCLCLVSACQTPQAPSTFASKPRSETPRLILVSIDGFRPDYLERGVTPNLKSLAKDGAVGAMRPSFPSLTFPNHYTLVTGLRPDHHGIVGNTMRDPKKPDTVFRMSNREAVRDGFWWDEAKPFWVSMREQNQIVATLFWPGSEAEIRGQRPNYWLPFDEKMPHETRVNLVLNWIDLPVNERPQAMTLYYSDVDTAGHDFGPDSPEVNEALKAVDVSIGQLIEGLKARGLMGKVNLLIVSDHGMSKHDPSKFIKVADLLPEGSADITGGQTAGFTPRPGREAEVDKALLKPHDHMQCWRKENIPIRFHFGKNPRIAPIVCLVEQGGFIIASSNTNWMPKPNGGSHGYDPYLPEMEAIFIAHGPDIKPGIRLNTFEMVDVYPLLMHLLSLPPEANDGRLRPLVKALKQP